MLVWKFTVECHYRPLYRSTILSGEAQGWTTHEVDLTAFMDDYIQIGATLFMLVVADTLTRPLTTRKYYMITDRMNIQLTDDSGNSWYVNSTTTDGYYDGALGGASGVPSHHCQQYGYTNNPLGTFYRDNSPQGWAWVETTTRLTATTQDTTGVTTALHGHGA